MRPAPCRGSGADRRRAAGRAKIHVRPGEFLPGLISDGRGEGRRQVARRLDRASAIAQKTPVRRDRDRRSGRGRGPSEAREIGGEASGPSASSREERAITASIAENSAASGSSSREGRGASSRSSFSPPPAGGRDDPVRAARRVRGRKRRRAGNFRCGGAPAALHAPASIRGSARADRSRNRAGRGLPMWTSLPASHSAAQASESARGRKNRRGSGRRAAVRRGGRGRPRLRRPRRRSFGP